MPDGAGRFTVESGGGVLRDKTVRRNADGIVVAAMTLSLRPGSTTVTVGILGSGIEEGRIVVPALTGTPKSIAPVRGGNQQAEIGELLPTRLFVFLSGAEGNSVLGSNVEFGIGSVEGMTAPSQIRTDTLGQAAALWRHGMNEGPHVTSPSVNDRATFTARGLPTESTEESEAAAREPTGLGQARVLPRVRKSGL
jgi:hypothetical protein